LIGKYPDIEELLKKAERKIKVLEKEIALKISNILSDNVARTPAFGQSSVLYFGGRDVAVKTGTTNNYKDAWIIGYTPSVALGAWAGNNDNTPMEKKVAGFIVAPMWRAFMNEILATVPHEQFEEPLVEDTTYFKPVLQGIWQGGILASSTSSSNTRVVTGGPHTILNWVDKDDPRGEYPDNPEKDSQFDRWEYSVRLWAKTNGLTEDRPFILN